MHDAKCYELAAYFLPSDANERARNMLAEQIQEAVEMWLCSPEAVSVEYAAGNELSVKLQSLHS